MFVQLVAIRGVNWIALRICRDLRQTSQMKSNCQTTAAASKPIKLSACSSARHFTATFTITSKHTETDRLLSLVERKELSSNTQDLDGNISRCFCFCRKTHSGNRCCNKSKMTPSRLILHFISSEWNPDPGHSCGSGSFQFHVLWCCRLFHIVIKMLQRRVTQTFVQCCLKTLQSCSKMQY